MTFSATGVIIVLFEREVNKMNEDLIKQYMKKYSCTREEAISVIKEDEEVDHMTSSKQIDADLTEEQRKAKKENTKTTGDKRNKGYTFERKPREKDAEKVELLEKIFASVSTFTENCVISNAGKEITFTVNDGEFSLSLTKHRPPKEKKK